jgi:hypothetical protein
MVGAGLERRPAPPSLRDPEGCYSPPYGGGPLSPS